QLSFGAYFTRHARNFCGETIELIDHRVDGVLEFEDLALGVDRDLGREIAFRDAGRDLSDVSYLAGEIAGHGVHGFGKVFPNAGDTLHIRLPPELSVSTY